MGWWRRGPGTGRPENRRGIRAWSVPSATTIIFREAITAVQGCARGDRCFLGAERARHHGVPLFAAALLLAVLLGVPPGNPATAGPPDRPSLTFSQNVLVDDGAGNAWTPTNR